MSQRSEAKTRRELVDPKLKDAGWFTHNWQVEDEYKITAGRIHFDGKNASRERPQKADYLLRFQPSKAIAIVEAKKEGLSHLEGAAQAKEYAQKLGLWFAYSTNGHEIEFFDLKAGTQSNVKKFHSPDELWALFLKHSQIKATESNVRALTHDYYNETQIGQRRTPRYYQEKAVNGAIEAVIKGENRVLIAQATGTGKTFTSLQLVYKLWKSRVAKKILFIVDRNLLADQAFKDFDNAMDKDACYRLSPKDKQFPLSRDLYFGIYQTLVGQDDEGNAEGSPDRYKEFPADFFDLIVIDEAHRGAANQAGSWFRLLEYFKSAIQVGLTATPRRDESHDTYGYFGNPVVSYSLKDGIEDGYLSPYIIKRVTSNIDALGYRPEHNEVRDVRGQTLQVKDYLTPDFERQLSIPQRTKAFAYHLLRHLFATDPLGKTIVFCIDQQHALDMAKFCQVAFLEYKKKFGFDYDGQYAIRITGNDRDANGKYAYLEKFQDLESNEPIVVTTSKLLTTGVDVKTVKNIVIFRNIGSMVEFKQIIGRGTRTYDHIDPTRQKLGFFILEYANYSTQLFNDPDWDDEPQEFVNEGAIMVDDTLDADDDDEQSHQETNEVPVAEAEDETHVDSRGLYEEPDEEARRQLRYRMSEEFLSGRIAMAAESISYTGPDGKPLSPEKFILYQSEALQKQVKDLKALSKLWQGVKTRKQFVEETAPEMGIHVDALTQIFFDRYAVRDVDILDVIAKLLFNEEYLTKGERIAKAKELHPDFFKKQVGKTNEIVEDILSVYQDMNFKPLTVSKEFWQTPKLSKYGSITEIQNQVGGSENFIKLINGLQEAIYDERITA
jgi:type I restriction enzyme R subunit